MKMKKLHLFFIVAMLLLFGSVYSQTIPNPGFENWHTKYLTPQLQSWKSVSSESEVLIGKPNVLKSSDAASGKYSVKVMGTVRGFPGLLFQGDIVKLKG